MSSLFAEKKNLSPLHVYMSDCKENSGDKELIEMHCLYHGSVCETAERDGETVGTVPGFTCSIKHFLSYGYKRLNSDKCC